MLEVENGVLSVDLTMTGGDVGGSVTLPVDDDPGTVEALAPSQVTYENNGGRIVLDGYGTEAEEVGSIKAFQYRGAFTASNAGVTLSFNGAGANNVIIKDGSNRQMTLNDFSRYDYFMVQKASPNWILVGGSQHVPYTDTRADARIAVWGQVGRSASAARTDLGLGTAALLNTGNANGNVVQLGADTFVAEARLPILGWEKGGLNASASNAGGARTNLGLGSAATLSSGSSIGNVATLGTGGRFDVARVAWTGSQTAYDALTPDASTLYLVTS